MRGIVRDMVNNSPEPDAYDYEMIELNRAIDLARG